jgi:hypothetical protein
MIDSGRRLYNKVVLQGILTFKNLHSFVIFNNKQKTKLNNFFCFNFPTRKVFKN